MAAHTFDDAKPAEKVSGWAIGGIMFAAAMMLLAGVFQIIAGLAAILDDEFFVVTRHYAFDLDVSVWGWVHLVLGILLCTCGIGLLRRTSWAAVTGIFLAMLSAFANFFFIPYYPFWSLLVIALDIWVIWALTRPGALDV